LANKQLLLPLLLLLLFPAHHSPSPAPVYYTSSVTSNASKAPKVGDKVKFTGKISSTTAGASVEGRFISFFFTGLSNSRIKCDDNYNGTTDATGSITVSWQLTAPGAVGVRAQGVGVVNPQQYKITIAKK
jgi:hypothetical protein